MGALRITPPLALAAAGALAVIIAAILAGWLTIARLEPPAATGNGNADIIAAAFVIARHSATLSTNAAIPTRLSDTPDTLAMRTANIDNAAAALSAQLDILAAADADSDAVGPGYPDRIAAIRAHTDALIANSRLIDAGRGDLLRLLTDGRDNYRKFAYDYHRDLDNALVTSLDDQLYAMMTWQAAAGQSADPADNPVSRAAILRHQHTFELLASVRVVLGKLLEASVLSHPFQVVLVQEEYEAAAQRMQSSLQYLATDDPPLPPEISRLAQEIMDAGRGDSNLFQTLQRRLNLAAAEQQHIDDNRQIHAQLLHETDALAAETQLRAHANSSATTQTAATARLILIIIGATGILGTLAAAAYFANRAGRD